MRQAIDPNPEIKSPVVPKDSLCGGGGDPSLETPARTLRVLVAIASYGVKHLEFLKEIIRKYQAMRLDINIVVLSEAPKDLGPGVEVIVGLPTKNPWSLPFAHKAVFAQRADQYDLFVYTEDDNDVSEDNLHAFLELTAQLNPDEIAGFLRYEIYPSGEWFLDEVFGQYHWKPDSVRRRGDHAVAEFTNEHAGFYILTRSQLKRAIASGGYLVPVHEGTYGLPETAATGAYTHSGFRKVICISSLERFLIRHMDDKYVGLHDVSLPLFKEQIHTLNQIASRTHPATSLADMESKIRHCRWHKSYYEKPD